MIGDGGREHALAWKISHSPQVDTVFVAPGNAGTANEAKMENIAVSGNEELANFAESNGISLTVVGPEAPLQDGIVDLFHSRNLQIVGPTQKAALLETSKSFAKQFMARRGIPTASYGVFDEPELANEFLQEMKAPYVVKADGLSAGKGVLICQTIEEAKACVEEMLSGKFGTASETVVIEEYLEGEETSFFVLSNGRGAVQLGTSRDYKRLHDGGNGPNTGGMGAVSPSPVWNCDLENKVMKRIVIPTIEGMAREKTPYTGFLYVGLMIREYEPYVLEYNCRFGDPECQVVMPRLQSDLFEMLAGSLRKEEHWAYEVEWGDTYNVGVVMATEGYATNNVSPGNIAELGNGLVFHAKTVATGSGLSHSGGRALCVVGEGSDVEEARKAAYYSLKEVGFPGSQFRTDIGLDTKA